MQLYPDEWIGEVGVIGVLYISSFSRGLKEEWNAQVL